MRLSAAKEFPRLSHSDDGRLRAALCLPSGDIADNWEKANAGLGSPFRTTQHSCVLYPD